mgnify:CR=1 FL=1
MQLHQIKRRFPQKTAKRVGRGGKRGTFSGRGTKGQKARAGHKMRPELRDIIKKIPKLRGYRAKVVPRRAASVNVGILGAHFDAGETVSPETLAERGLIGRRGGKLPVVKVLGSGDVSKNFSVKDCEISASARAKIEKAGGSVAA